MSPQTPAPLSTGSTTREARLLSTLRSVDFPATKDDLLRVAVLDHLEVATIDALRELPGHDYHGVTQVMRSLPHPVHGAGSEYAAIA